jgi:hypothetical protein
VMIAVTGVVRWIFDRGRCVVAKKRGCGREVCRGGARPRLRLVAASTATYDAAEAVRDTEKRGFGGPWIVLNC